jgi:uncharacterized protein YndB with AHSA1/START domain
MNSPKFVYVTYIATTPEKLWNALTQGKFTEQYWFGTVIETTWAPGSALKFKRGDDLIVSGKVIESKPYTRLSYTWVHEKDGQFRDEKPSQVAFEIEQMGENVKLTVLHDNFAPDSKVFGMISVGWPMVLASLKSLLEIGHALSTAKPECGQSLREKTPGQVRGAA